MRKRKGIQRIITWAVMMVMATSFAACGRSSEKNETAATVSVECEYDSGGSACSDDIYVYSEMAVPEEAVMEMEDASYGDEHVGAESGQKLITTVQMSVETDSFEELTANIESKAAGLGGYVERMDIYTGNQDHRYASYTIRIPEELLDEFTKTVSSESNVISRTCSVEDVTLSYVDMQSRKQVLLTEEERLMEMLEEAEDVETMLLIETRLSEVRAERESMESRLRAYDNEIAYSTIYLDITEVKVFTVVEEESTWTKISQGFHNSVENLKEDAIDLGVRFVVNLPYTILYLLLIFICYIIFRIVFHIIKKKIVQKRAEKEAAMQAQMTQNAVSQVQVPTED